VFKKNKHSLPVVEKTLNPSWSEVVQMCVQIALFCCFSLPISGAFDDDDTIEVVCHGKKDAVLGSIAIPLKDFKTSGAINKSFPLTSKSKSMLSALTFVSSCPCAAEEAASGFIEFDFVVEGCGGGSGALVLLLLLCWVT
jgi:hypothetical protein